MNGGIHSSPLAAEQILQSWKPPCPPEERSPFTVQGETSEMPGADPYQRLILTKAQGVVVPFLRIRIGDG